MAHPPTAARLFRRMRGRRAPSQPDFGDHGTAFGMELSMSPPDTEPDPPAGMRREPPRPPGFWRRLADRRHDDTD
jgi:hypothetical protein